MRALHEAALRPLIVAQFGQWDDAVQAGFFAREWAPERYEILEIEGRPVGCLAVEEFVDRLFLVEIRISPEFQGRGIGSSVIQLEIARARALQKALHLQVFHKNKRARALYERLGFVVESTTDTHFRMFLA